MINNDYVLGEKAWEEINIIVSFSFNYLMPEMVCFGYIWFIQTGLANSLFTVFS